MSTISRNLFKTLTITLLALFLAAPLAAGPVSLGAMKQKIRKKIKVKLKHMRLKKDGEGQLSRVWKDGEKVTKFEQGFQLFWTGKFGQKLRQTMGIHYEKIDGRYQFDGLSWGDTTVIKGPTVKLPPAPAEPMEDVVKKQVTKQLKPKYGCHRTRGAGVCELTMDSIKPAEKKFAWVGYDYDLAVYTYTGKMTYTVADSRKKQSYSCSYKLLMQMRAKKGKAWKPFLSKSKCKMGKRKPVSRRRNRLPSLPKKIPSFGF